MLKKLFQTDLRFDWKIVTTTVVSTLLVLIDHYHVFTSWKPLDRTILYLVIPLAFILFVFRENPREYGFQLGEWKIGLALTFGARALILPILWLLTRGDQSMRGYYKLLIGSSLPVYTFFDLIGWEFIFRGWLTFAYVRKFGAEGLWLQSVPFAIAHISKPEVETLSTIFGGFVFGWVAWRTKSFLYPFLILWAIFTFVILVAGGAFG